ncbi:Uncharacterised protein [Sphingobacterium thalpophilum]|uniref:Uncharacterized protein n=1 Tax=Sphingobacterium thalpophilum TaxID=259 RepID=A0A4V6KVW1_9SPHI|nr:Uncharacterised protein [Sphingobacterium thalpophilum]
MNFKKLFGTYAFSKLALSHCTKQLLETFTFYSSETNSAMRCDIPTSLSYQETTFTNLP